MKRKKSRSNKEPTQPARAALSVKCDLSRSKMLAWDPTWRHITDGPLPRWFTKACRDYLVARGQWEAHDNVWDSLNNKHPHEFRPLLDHVGTVGKGRYRSMVLQPYGREDKLAIQFAGLIGAKLKIVFPGIWNGRQTTTYVFTSILPHRK